MRRPIKKTMQARENVKFSIEVKDGENRPLPAAIAIAVTDSRITDPADNGNDSLSALSAEDADLVMLTGADSYRDIIETKAVNRIAAREDSFTVSGKVFNRRERGRKPAYSNHSFQQTIVVT